MHFRSMTERLVLRVDFAEELGPSIKPQPDQRIAYW
jgi:hypothetical protein